MAMVEKHIGTREKLMPLQVAKVMAANILAIMVQMLDQLIMEESTLPIMEVMVLWEDMEEDTDLTQEDTRECQKLKPMLDMMHMVMVMTVMD